MRSEAWSFVAFGLEILSYLVKTALAKKFKKARGLLHTFLLCHAISVYIFWSCGVFELAREPWWLWCLSVCNSVSCTCTNPIKTYGQCLNFVWGRVWEFCTIHYIRSVSWAHYSQYSFDM
ncbi:unnamed protein product [Brassica oleracea]